MKKATGSSKLETRQRWYVQTMKRVRGSIEMVETEIEADSPEEAVALRKKRAPSQRFIGIRPANEAAKAYRETLLAMRGRRMVKCNCVELVDERVKDAFGEEFSILTHGGKAAIELRDLRRRKRGAAPAVVGQYCPFCGVAYAGDTEGGNNV